MLRRAEPDGQNTAFSSRNYICVPKISPAGIKPVKTVNHHTKSSLPRKISLVDYYAWSKKEII